ncbi:alcaligin biosynthesis protein [Microbulbifer agarilyticus]|uniref:Alcaligin biosynthesis protein n=1 Tax=Microbulbifer agarilyticus TaxID=260552 RepID=A0A1Q2M273_9GAMM|nr:SidA/IucD/PvdA family monooxygenase [Microbulbifer agarilyticus]AQQ66367.1 alcaligin biosynthesis protein [Microbulbifer agarilyticus]
MNESIPNLNSDKSYNTQSVYDFIGIGVGPFNLGLACLTQDVPHLRGLFLEQRDCFDWHPGLMLDGVHLQTPFMSDLVTLADPTHRLSFLNYIKQLGQIYSFYIREDFFLLRQEYNQYCQWAAQQCKNILWQKTVTEVVYDDIAEHYNVYVGSLSAPRQECYRAKKLVLGTGPSPTIPEQCQEAFASSDNVLHSGEFLKHKARLQDLDSITVIGSGQSAGEIFHELLAQMDDHAHSLNWITRSPRFFPLEYTKLTLEMTSPEYIDYFYGLESEQRDALGKSQKNLYKGIDGDLINGIFETLYARRVRHQGTDGGAPVNILTNSALTELQCSPPDFQLTFEHHEQAQHYSVNTSAVVLATGYSYQEPAFLEGIRDRIAYDASGRFAVTRDYAIDKQGGEIYVQNAELHTHGFAAPDLGMAAYRNSILIRELAGKEIYPIEQRIAFQQFGALQGLAQKPPKDLTEDTIANAARDELSRPVKAVRTRAEASKCSA